MSYNPEIQKNDMLVEEFQERDYWSGDDIATLGCR